jgi:hypothetical protein
VPLIGSFFAIGCQEIFPVDAVCARNQVRKGPRNKDEGKERGRAQNILFFHEPKEGTLKPVAFGRRRLEQRVCNLTQ